MNRKPILVIILLFILLSLIHAADSEVWSQIFSEASDIDLSQTDYSTTALARVGSFSTQDIALNFDCNYSDDEGYFQMRSASNPDSYRNFEVYLRYRDLYGEYSSTYGERDRACYVENSLGQTISECSGKIGTFPALPALGTHYDNNYWSYIIGGYTSYCDYVYIGITFEDDTSNLVEASDYQCILTVTATGEDGFSKVMMIPLQGYYLDDDVDDLTEDGCFLDIDNYGVILNLREMDGSSRIDVGSLFFSTVSKSSTTSYTIKITPSTDSSDEGRFWMKHTGIPDTNDETLLDQYRVPLRIWLNGTSVSGSNVTSPSLDSASDRSVSTVEISQDTSGNILTYTGSSATVNYEYNAVIQAGLEKNYDTDKLEDLYHGNYRCYVYFHVLTNQ